MSGQHDSAISEPLARLIEDTVLFGKDADLEAIIRNIAADEDFPPELRHGLEGLHYFRSYYGQQAALPEAEKKKVALMDTAWVAELLDMLKHIHELPVAAQA